MIDLSVEQVERAGMETVTPGNHYRCPRHRDYGCTQERVLDGCPWCDLDTARASLDLADELAQMVANAEGITGWPDHIERKDLHRAARDYLASREGESK